MTIRKLLIAAAVSLAALSAQEPDTDPSSRAGLMIFVPDAPELKQYLGLTDAQIKSLQDIQKQRQESANKVYEQIRQKQVTVQELLRNNSRDAARIGQLTLEINDLQKQAVQPVEPYRSQALAVLTQEQKNKLPALATSLQLGQPAYQAVYLNLLDGPGPRPLPAGPIPAVTLPAISHAEPAANSIAP